MHTFGAARLCLLSLIVLAAACNSEAPVVTEPPPGAAVARVRVVNAAPGVSNVEVVRAGVAAPVAQNLNFGAFTQTCLQVPSQTEQTLSFRTGGTEIASATFTPAAGERYSVFLTGSGTTRRAVVLSDQTTAAAGTNGLRFINVSSGPGDVYVTAPDGELTASMRVSGNLGVTAMDNSEPPYIAADTARTQVRFYDVNATSGTPRAEYRLSGLPATRLVNVVLADVPVAGPSASFVTYPCS